MPCYPRRDVTDMSISYTRIVRVRVRVMIRAMVRVRG